MEDYMINQVFGELTVLSRTNNKGSHKAYICQCSCGALETCIGSYLRSGVKVRCKHCNHRDSLDDIIGTKIGEWTVCFSTDRPNRYICECSCGEMRTVRGRDLLKGKSRSCGCQRRKR